MHDDERWMTLALEEAARGAEAGEVPVGAVVVVEGRLVARARNAPISLADPTAHAEVLALRAAARETGNYRLTGATLYVTIEPCLMCCGAALHARIARLVYGAADPKAGAVQSLYRVLEDARLNHRVEVAAGVLGAACGAQLSEFFRARRA
jgi:tRNA(adenine34) deaminase